MQIKYGLPRFLAYRELLRKMRGAPRATRRSALPAAR